MYGAYIEALPQTYAVNFCYYISLVEGDNITLTTRVTTDLFTLFNGSVTWRAFKKTEQDLPPTAKVINYISDGVFHSNLSLYDLSDSMNYTCTASNDDISQGMSLFFVIVKHCYQLLFLI